MRTPVRALALASAALAGVLVLTGCNDRTEPSAGQPTTRPAATTVGQHFNDADVTFAQQVIEHHRQTIEMTDLAATQAQSPQVKAIAAVIRSTQAAEIQIMTGWLQAWDAPVPTQTPMWPAETPAGLPTGTEGAAGLLPTTETPPLPMGTETPFMPTYAEPTSTMESTGAPSLGAPSIPGMLTPQEMNQLRSLRGAQFERLFVELMIRHHSGAIEMAEIEQIRGKDADALELARRIEINQSAELAELRELLR
ncbi:hypothetical protein LI90_500 [Carbonactinospora thermoautotrophica]|uniref:DUF305 domain-containing protein n=1 Tax=Carbonactinospora thermoautotrophica TaxID=1469144 RepID=A0A132MLY5_9ACTN|nr:DUF305 domain-containing protein [Carbonactinospora thermoautotrophica]KWW98870.1 hypothetical protein LI90_500 [Carbonactinospora thermoautotrophica]